MNILIPHISFEVFGGAEIVVSKLSEHLVKNGHSVHILAYKCPPEIYGRFKGCQITTGAYPKLKEFIHDNYSKFDIINSHNHPMELLLWPKKRIHIWSYNEEPYYVQLGQELNPVERNIINNSVTVAVVANEKNNQRYKSLFDTPTFINMYGIEPDFYFPNDCGSDEFRKKYNISTNDFVIGCIGWVHFHKRQRDLAEAFTKIKNEIPNSKLLLVGPQDPNEVGYISKIVNKDIIMTGPVNRETARNAYFASNVIVCPFSEQGGYLSMLESLCTDRPVIISPNSMLGDDLSNAGVGIITKDYASAILDIYKGNTSCNFTKWRNWASQFTWNRYCSNMVSLFETVLEKNY